MAELMDVMLGDERVGKLAGLKVVKSVDLKGL